MLTRSPLKQLRLGVAVCLITLGIVLAPFASASALSGSQFNSGRIIDDSVFFNPTLMSAGQIQTFLNAKVPNCDTNGTQPYAGTTRAAYGASRGYPAPYTCLRDFSQTIPDRSADAYCGGSVTGGTKTAAQIIYDVSQACGVSPKVMIILLQKEQSLITDDWPWSIQYTKATGYGCPDSSLSTDVDSNQNGCYDQYEGFFNQIYYGARQYQRYAKQPSLYNYRGGATSYVQYNPNAGCGGGNIAMQNQATAGLYNYTPYQPNAAALNNLYGTGDNCSAYGNRNFWRMYIDWFGSTTSNTPYLWAYEGQWAYSDSQRTQRFTTIPTLQPGQTMYLRVKARNMGTQEWSKNTIRLGTSRPIDSASPFANGSWISNTRAATLVEDSVPSGQIGTFDFTMTAPSATGTYNQYFNVLAEGITWLNDLGLFFTINVNTTASPSNAINTTLNAGETLNINNYLLSPDSDSTLSLNRNGNLELATNFNTVWQTGSLSGANRLVMQPDGNLVVYNQSNQALWASSTDGNPGSKLVLQTDGNMVIYNSSNAAIWATYTIHNPELLSFVNTTLPTGRMYPGQSISTADRKYKLLMQRDGNLVLYSPSRALWASGTDGKSIAFLAMQPDGNLVLYDTNFKPLWYSGTSVFSLLRLVVQQDGNLVLYDGTNRPFWNTGTSGQ